MSLARVPVFIALPVAGASTSHGHSVSVRVLAPNTCKIPAGGIAVPDIIAFLSAWFAG